MNSYFIFLFKDYILTLPNVYLFCTHFIFLPYILLPKSFLMSKFSDKFLVLFSFLNFFLSISLIHFVVCRYGAENPIFRPIGANIIHNLEYYTSLKGTVARDFCIKLRLWGVRLGPTDGTHPLLTSVHCPFNLLRTFKEGVHRSKTDCILLTDTHVFAYACPNYHACMSE